MTVSYNLAPEDYQNYVSHMSGKSMEEKQKKSYVTAIMQIILAPMFLYLRSLGNLGEMGYILAGIMLASGIYHFVFFKLIYPRSVQKAALKTYEKRGYRDISFTLTFNADGILFSTQDKTESFSWQDIRRIDETKDAFYFVTSESRALILPKRGCEDQMEELRQLKFDAGL